MEAGTKVYLVPIIVKKIMKYLSIRELRTCQKLCLLWNDLATQEICRRQYFVPFSHGPYCLVHHTSHAMYNECKKKHLSTLSDYDLNEYMKGISAVSAQMCITFVTISFAAWYGADDSFHLPRRKDSVAMQDAKMRIQNTLMRRLSPGTISQLYVAYGIVFWSSDGVPLESEGKLGMSGVIIPDDPELKIYSCGPEAIYVSRQDNLDKCSLLKKIPKDVDIKSLLLFAENCDLFRRYINFVEACQDRQNTIISVGGLRLQSHPLDKDTDSKISDSCKISDLDSKKESDAAIGRDSGVYSGQVIAFCGERVEAASVINYSSDSEETIVQNLSKFQEIGLQKKKCLAFVFINSNHVARYHKKCNYESSIFHRLYPDVPLIGAFGTDLIGKNTFPKVAAESLDMPNKSMDKSCMYEHKSVFVFIATSMAVECGDFTD